MVRWIVILLIATCVPFGLWLGAQVRQQSRVSDYNDKMICCQHLDYLALWLEEYAKAHGGKYPPTLMDAVFPGDTLDHAPTYLVCPRGPERCVLGSSVVEIKSQYTPDHHCSYLYFGGGKTVEEMRGRLIILEKKANHFAGQKRWGVRMGVSHDQSVTGIPEAEAVELAKNEVRPK